MTRPRPEALNLYAFEDPVDCRRTGSCGFVHARAGRHDSALSRVLPWTFAKLSCTRAPDRMKPRNCTNFPAALLHTGPGLHVFGGYGECYGPSGPRGAKFTWTRAIPRVVRPVSSIGAPFACICKVTADGAAVLVYAGPSTHGYTRSESLSSIRAPVRMHLQEYGEWDGRSGPCGPSSRRVA